MEKPQLMNLDLRAPLFYAKTADLPSDLPPNMAENEEVLFCFDLDPAQSRSIEPKTELLLGPLVFSGRKAGNFDAQQGEAVLLPTGKYLFVQCMDALNMAQWLDLAVEQQKDGLWERHRPENRLYVRYLHEDGRFVTQLFRPILTY